MTMRPAMLDEEGWASVGCSDARGGARARDFPIRKAAALTELGFRTVVVEGITRTQNEQYDSEMQKRETRRTRFTANQVDPTFKVKKIENELADVTFEQLQKAMSDGSNVARVKHAKTDENSKRLNKNRPAEMSSKKPVKVFREVIQVPKKVSRDPRFDSISGDLDPEGFRKRYNFLYEVQLPAEKENLKRLLEKSKNQDTIEELKDQISWIDKQIKSAPHHDTESEIRSEHYKKEKEAAKHGKRPYFLKKSEIRNLMLTKKYEELKDQGKVEKVIEKRRKKNAAKDHRFVPYRRPMGNAHQ